MMEKHFVTFYSPGTFFSEQSSREIDSWDVGKAKKMADSISERYGATPYGFQFSTRTRKEGDLDSKESNRSLMYYLGGKVETLAEVEARNLPEESILRSNMRGNNIERIIVNDNSYRFTAALHKDDIVLDYTPPSKRAEK